MVFIEEMAIPVFNVNKWRSGIIKEIIKLYNPKNVINADEVGIFFQLLPSTSFSLTVKGEM